MGVVGGGGGQGVAAKAIAVVPSALPRPFNPRIDRGGAARLLGVVEGRVGIAWRAEDRLRAMCGAEALWGCCNEMWDGAEALTGLRGGSCEGLPDQYRPRRWATHEDQYAPVDPRPPPYRWAPLTTINIRDLPHLILKFTLNSSISYYFLHNTIEISIIMKYCYL